MCCHVSAPADDELIQALAEWRNGEMERVMRVRGMLGDAARDRAWRLALDAHLHASGVAEVDDVQVDALVPLVASETRAVAHAAQRIVIRAAQHFDRELAERVFAVGVRTGVDARDELGSHWMRWISGVYDVDGSRRLEREAHSAGLADVVVDAAALRALALAEQGELEEALEQARRASRMARTEGLPQAEYLANLALARVRRLSGRPYLAMRILTALRRFVSPAWLVWLDWELVLSGGTADAGPAAELRSLVNAAGHGDRNTVQETFDRLLARVRGVSFAERDVTRVRAVLDSSFEADAETAEWRSGRVEDPPCGSIALASTAAADAPRVQVIVEPGRAPGLRSLRVGPGCLLKCDVELVPLQRRESRTDAVLAALALAGNDGENESSLFEKVWGFSFSAERHQDVLNMAVSRARARVAEVEGKITRSSGRLVLEVGRTLRLPDPRGGTRADDRLLWYLAREGSTTASSAADALGVPLRTVQASLKALVEDGFCSMDRRGRQAEYRVEDTTFQEPTRSGAHSGRTGA